MTDSFLLGMAHRQGGRSIHYNPYRHSDDSNQFMEWEQGWFEANAEISGKNPFSTSQKTRGGTDSREPKCKLSH